MIAISILGIKDQENKIKEIDNLKPDYIHLDIMDGVFVSNKTDLTTIPTLESKLDVHLMVKDIVSYIDLYKNLRPDYITFHIEVTDTPLDIINYIHSLGIKVGISIKPGTCVEEIKPYLENIDLVLVMSVEPGYGGQVFIPSSIDKVKELKKLKEQYNYHYIIEIDGGINDITIIKCTDVDMKVVGSYITSSNNYSDTLSKLKKLDT